MVYCHSVTLAHPVYNSYASFWEWKSNSRSSVRPSSMLIDPRLTARILCVLLLYLRLKINAWKKKLVWNQIRILNRFEVWTWGCTIVGRCQWHCLESESFTIPLVSTCVIMPFCNPICLAFGWTWGGLSENKLNIEDPTFESFGETEQIEFTSVVELDSNDTNSIVLEQSKN